LKKKNLYEGQHMKRMILLVVCSVLLPFHVSAKEIVNNNFNSGSWAGMAKGSYWTMQQTGGVGNSPAARLEYSVAGNPGKALMLDVRAHKSNQYWIELDVKMQNQVSGGQKFIKFFGSTSKHSQNNMTLQLDYHGNVQKEVCYSIDTNCGARYNGTNGGPCNPTHIFSSSAVDMRGGNWGHYKAWVKRADPGASNGEIKIWWNGKLRSHITKMSSNPSGSSTPFFEKIEFGGYNHAATFNGSTWYFWIDNLYVGTTEKGGTSTPAPTPEPVASPKAPAGFKENL
jgi:hypothetical protein